MIIPLLLVLEFVVLVAAVGWLARGRLAGVPGSWRAWRPGTELVLLAGLTASAPLAVELAPVPVRAVLGSCALLLAPGAAVLAVWPVRDVLDRLLLTVVLSATIVLLLSMVMLWTDLWSPVLLVHLAALGAAPVLALRGLSRMSGAAAGPRAAPAGVT